MVYIISPISVAQAATIINAFITFVQFTISISLVILLVYLMPKSNTASAWSSISRTLQSSVWPTILRTDSSSSREKGASVSTIGTTATITTVLVAIAGIVLPLGLSEGPMVPANFRTSRAQYVPDSSPLALSTTPNREEFVYGRVCSNFGPVICPGNNNANDSTIAPSVRDIFNSTPHGLFAMEYRKFYQGSNNLSSAIMGTAETFVLRNDTFVAEGLIIDMSPDRPGIGFWNQTLPPLKRGGTWSQDVLWLEPVTQCVDTNLTVDYVMNNGPNGLFDTFNLTDHGGFVNLTRVPPSLNRDGQQIDLFQHAYKGAAYSDFYAMLFLNATRESSSIGTTYPMNSSIGSSLSGTKLGSMSVLSLSYLNSTANSGTEIICQGYGGGDNANVTNVHVNCGIFLGPPLRMDGGDPRNFDRGSRWTQGLHACSSATHASIQTVTFATNSTTDIANLKVTRAPSNLDVLWATEKTNLTIKDVDLLWARVDDRYENDPSLWTVRADGFYLPAGASSYFNVFGDGMPGSAHAHIWGQLYESSAFNSEYVTDYSGKNDYSIRVKMQSLIVQNPAVGNAQIRNLAWTDMMANNLIGTQKNNTVWVADHLSTIQYDFKYAIPGLLLLLIWVPSFLGAALLLLTRKISFEHMRAVLNHTSVGRVVVGTSALRAQTRGAGYMEAGQPNISSNTSGLGPSLGHRRNKSDWQNTAGSIQVTLDLAGQIDYSGGVHEEDVKLMPVPQR